MGTLYTFWDRIIRIRLKVYTFGGLSKSATKDDSLLFIAVCYIVYWHCLYSMLNGVLCA